MAKNVNVEFKVDCSHLSPYELDYLESRLPSEVKLSKHVHEQLQNRHINVNPRIFRDKLRARNVVELQVKKDKTVVALVRARLNKKKDICYPVAVERGIVCTCYLNNHDDTHATKDVELYRQIPLETVLH